MQRGDFGHLLVDGDGVAIRGPELAAGQPGANAVVVMAEAARMMQAADRSDRLTMLLERLERSGELVIRAGLGDLVIERMDAIGEVDKRAAPRRDGRRLRCP